MITEKRLTSVEEVFAAFSDIPEDPTIKRFRSPYMYRGLSNADYKLQTSLDRTCGRNLKLEKCILRNFTKYASIIENPYLVNSEWRQLIVGQHHGLPTRLLDWTYSSLVALHFATSEDSLKDLDQHDCAIWAIDLAETNSMLPPAYKKILHDEEAWVFTTEMFEKNKITLDKYDIDMADNAFVMLEPPSIDERIVNQYSYFSVTPAEITNLDQFLDNKTQNTIKYIISKDIRWQIRDTLDTMNINERIIYPGYDGLCQWLKRHYFKR